jgi:hypothetical protein
LNTIVLHGDNYLGAKKRLDAFIVSAKKRSWLIDRLASESLNNLSELVSGANLFSKERLIIIEGLNRVPPKQIKWVSDNKDRLDVTLVFINNGYVNKRILATLPKKTKVEVFRLPKEVFDFLYSFYPGNAKHVLTLLKRVLEKEPVEAVFGLLSRHIRDVYWALENPKRLPYKEAWRISRLVSQSKKFKAEGLKRIISSLADIDLKAKSSKAKLNDSLDQIIITQLE